MPNGGPDHLPDIPWWQGIGAAFAAGLLYLTGRVRGRTAADSESATALMRTGDRFADEHERTREEVRQLIELVQGEHREQLALMREEGKAMRQVLYTVAKDLGDKLQTIDRDLARIMERWNRPPS